ncbi:MAG: hypothetical protein LUD69_01120, partial [Oscillospiraceae bacterium]|nr:hypothetical protein [Oscillospiraceae bacterium]
GGKVPPAAAGAFNQCFLKNVLLYSIDETNGTADIAWTFSARTKAAHCLKHISGKKKLRKC